MAARLLEALAQDTRHAFRAAARSPGLTIVVTLSLGLGIGANTAVFSVINAVMPTGGHLRLVEAESTGPAGTAAGDISHMFS